MRIAGILAVLSTTAVCLAVAGAVRNAPTAGRPDRDGRQGDRKKPMENLPRTDAKAPTGKEIATLAGGCFWCVEAIFTELNGVEKVEPGYAGGHVVSPTYEQVCGGKTGHAEAISITFDPKVIAFADVLRVFLTTHDPTTLNRQGADVGTQYRSAIFTHGKDQERVAREVLGEFGRKKIWKDPIVTEVTPFTNFYAAEDYHRDYFARNPNQGYCQAVIAPKVAKFRQMYRERLKKPVVR